MADIYSTSKRSDIMRRIGGKDTKPELVVRRILVELGLRYRLHSAKLPGTPDIVMKRRMIAILVQGCYWHRHECGRGRSRASSNAEFWENKILRNVERDAENLAALHNLGWRVIAVWECETRCREALMRRLSKEILP
jgi:DNA mismatch endonuclease (patch repair protein)